MRSALTQCNEVLPEVSLALIVLAIIITNVILVEVYQQMDRLGYDLLLMCSRRLRLRDTRAREPASEDQEALLGQENRWTFPEVPICNSCGVW